ncbi:hypothetical protein KSS93_21005 [Pseudomonas xanthosomatis]|uniref:hypothetical protein n=1 Tax=Pseudomonas xanthosomatis TaxID=2842356 RepID=UPI001C3D027E|nr:hypothetical protein [Pseudomonas xanthosomatis]QXH45335.1 hypothetical protein KSS93_21005 [Pseudomonas xanthosomatis]
MNEVRKIGRDLGLPLGDEYTQDWAYELSEEYRTKEWLERYIAAYLSGDYSPQGQRELMTLALDICNDLLSSGTSHADETLVKVLNALFDNAQVHSELIAHWALEGEPLEDCFALTPEVRRRKAQRVGG